MDIKLKKSKKIKAFIYRSLSMALLFITVFIGVIVLPVLISGGAKGYLMLLGAKPAGLAEYTEAFWTVFDNGLLAFSGADQNSIYPSTDISSAEIRAREEFQSAIENNGGNLIYCVYDSGTNRLIESNFDYPVFTYKNNSIVCNMPDTVDAYILWDGDSWLYNTNTHIFSQNKFMPDADTSSNLHFFLAAVEKPTNYPGSFTSDLFHQSRMYTALLWIFTAAPILFLILQFFVLLSRKAWKAAKADIAGVSVHICLELKLLAVTGIVWLLYYQANWFHSRLTMYAHSRIPFTGLLSLFVCGILFFLLWTDISKNQEKIFYAFLPSFLYRYFKRWTASTIWQRRIMLRCQILLLGSICMIGSSLFFMGIILWEPLSSHWPDYLIGPMLLPLCGLIAGVSLLLYSVRGQYLLFKETGSLTDILSKIRQGNLVKIPSNKKYAYLKDACEGLTELEKGIESAVEQKGRADRMRVELLTNVSHDLKTPLTSIINYADLLCEEELAPPASQYANSIREKSYTLKNMVQDVFELSKAATGNLTIEKTRLDLCRLIRQTLADMDERITGSTLTFKTIIPETPVCIEGDGNKLYRAFQNLYINALRYSLDHSRVYTQVVCTESLVTVKIKNTSKTELDFDTTEIMDRFVRADSSRTSEGSGLGLSIVQSFVAACEGQFRIETDADMFTAILNFPLAEELPSDTPAPGMTDIAQSDTTVPAFTAAAPVSDVTSPKKTGISEEDQTQIKSTTE